jgi:FAD/FMN-containing dehydrogenase
MSIEDLREAFVGKHVRIACPLGEILLGVVAPSFPGVAEGISRLLVRSIQDARATRGGHLPDWLVDDVERNYISPGKVRTLWASTGHRFAALYGGEIIGTIHVARDHDTILTIDRHRNNVSSRDYPGFKPDRHHHVVNISVKHELRRARLGTAMVDGIVEHFRALFDGDGLWVRADPPWHAGLVGLGFVHDPSMDIFLPPEVERTAGLPHAEFNRLYACDCRHPSPARPDALGERAHAMAEKKLQYVSFTRPFEPARSVSARGPGRRLVGEDLVTKDSVVLERYARDWGRVIVRRPAAVARPSDPDAVAAIMRRASEERTPVTVRGGGYSVEGQSLGDGLVMSTESLSRIVSVASDRVTVQGGVTWEALVRELTPRGLCPPVLTGWPRATVGGTLSTGGFSKGSHRHGLQIDHVLSLVVVTGDGRVVSCSSARGGWLYEAALGGLGRFGVVVEATLPLVAAPRVLHVSRTNVAGTALAGALEAAAAEPATYHVTSYRDPTADRFVVVTASADARAGASPVPFEDYAAPRRPRDPPGECEWLVLFVPSGALAPLLDASRRRLDFSAGDALQVIPVRKQRTRSASLLQTVDVADGTLVHGVSVTRELRGRPRDALRADLDALCDLALGLGAKRSPSGALPRTDAEWRAHLGPNLDAIERAKRIADPAGVLGATLVLHPSRLVMH